MDDKKAFISFRSVVLLIVGCVFLTTPEFSASPRLPISGSSLESPRPRVAASPSFEYLWYETENMRGISADSRHEPVLNPSWQELPASKAPGWGINGPGVSAEWSQGG